MEQVLEVTYFNCTLRVRFATDALTDSVQHVESWYEDEWFNKIRAWLLANHDARVMGLARAPLGQLFDLVKAIPGITSAEYIQPHPEDSDLRRGFIMDYTKALL